ncbi:MAG: ABC transporter ATP-binding protein [Actinobacteria bacterium]|nr:ABC transporter ATP-binding protein [Actinomycetota bacterium]
MIEVDRLTKRFGKTVAVEDLSFRVAPARVTGFLGPNGAGKTTTLKVMLGLTRPSAGSAAIGGRLYRDLDDPIRKVGAVLETSNYHPGRSGRNHLRVLAAAAGLPRSRVEEVLELVAMKDSAKRRVKGYSLGMRQRLGLAAALLGDPEVLVLDEPANGLDPAGIRWLRDLLRSLADQGRTVLVSSHLLAEMEQIADDVVVIHRGKFVAQASTAELAARATTRVRVRSPQSERLGELLVGRGATVEATDGGVLAVREASPEQVGEVAAANAIVLHELVSETATLEETFLELTGGETTS